MDHLPMTTMDWALLEQAIQKIEVGAWREPWVIACEYSGVGPWWQAVTDKAVLQAQVPRLYTLAHGND